VGRLSGVGLVLMAGGGRDIADELRKRFLAECDYQAEARNLLTFAELLGSIEGASVPPIVPSHCASTVLTMQFMPGMTFDAFREVASQDARDRAARIIAEANWRCIFTHGIFNADPHPGNYLFAEDGSVTFLDFGCVKQFSPSRMALWRRFARSIINQDRPTFEAAYREMGIVGREADFDWDGHWNMLCYLYRPFLQDVFEYTPEYVAEMTTLIRQTRGITSMRMPAEMLFTNRLQWGLNSVFSLLGGNAPWAKIFRRAVEDDFVPAHIVDLPSVGR
jgi:predicted unusual protein kinase regulating ubiquinone biosynthesis (AarF/ABC1/UbiB family)